jgi:hypothetical protein
MKIQLAMAAVISVTQVLSIPIVQEGFESPGTLSGPGYFQFVSGNDISGWTILDDNEGERPYIMDEARYASLGIDFFGKQALQLNEGSGIQTTVPLVAGETYTFSIWGYGDWYMPLQVSIGSLVQGINFQHYSLGGLQERTFTFVAEETDANAIFRILNPDFGVKKDFRQRTIDNVSFSRVPDGGTTAALLGLGIISLGLLRKRFDR